MKAIYISGGKNGFSVIRVFGKYGTVNFPCLGTQDKEKQKEYIRKATELYENKVWRKLLRIRTEI